MPLYFVYCPDYPNNLAKRMEHRKGHVDASAQNKATGKSVFGRAFLSDETATAPDGTKNPDQASGMAGSCMIYRYPSLEAAWARIKEDAYWTGGVWDKDKVVVKEIIGADGDDVVKLVIPEAKV